MRTFTSAQKSRSSLPILLVFLTMTLAGTLELILDAPVPLFGLHFFVDLSFVLLCLGAAAYLYWGWHEARRDLAGVQKALAERQVERDAWRELSRKYVAGLGEAIESQLHRWHLTRVERQTAFLLLKGYSHKEIARLTERSERTVRQHAVDIYRKSGLAGRAELSAFFLEDMLSPLPDPDGNNGDGEESTSPAAGGNGRDAARRRATAGA